MKRNAMDFTEKCTFIGVYFNFKKPFNKSEMYSFFTIFNILLKYDITQTNTISKGN